MEVLKVSSKSNPNSVAGALAGGIISVAIIKHDVKSDKFWIILQDSLNLVILSVVILFLAALIEVYITPVIFR